MARARNIKPGFFRNADLVELPFEARLLFIGLWTIADKAGRMDDRPKQIKMELFPADNLDCDSLLNMLQELGMIDRYTVGNKKYIQVVNFSKHQNPHRDEKTSVIPDKNGAALVDDDVKHSASTVQAQCCDGANTVAIGLIPESLIPESLIPESLIPESLIPESLIPETLIPESLIPESLIPETLKLTPESNLIAGYPAEFESAWESYPPRSGANKKSAFKAWSARLKAGVDAKQILNGVHRYANYCLTLKTEDRFIKQPVTFFGPDEHFLAEWVPVSPVVQNRSQSVQDARLDVARQIMGNQNGNDRSFIDITPYESIESDGTRIPETFDGVWKSANGEVARDQPARRLSGLG